MEIDGGESVTLYQTLARAHMPVKVGRYTSARYSLLKVCAGLPIAPQCVL